MSSDEDRYMRRLLHPRWIPNISDYCDRRCPTCAFRERCFVQDEVSRHRSTAGKNVAPKGEVAEYESKVPRRKSWIEQHPELLEAMNTPPSTDEVRDLETRLRTLHSDPMVVSAHNYVLDTFHLFELMERNLESITAPAEVASAVQDVFSLAGSIGAKVYRSVSSAYRNDEVEEVDSHRFAHGRRSPGCPRFSTPD